MSKILLFLYKLMYIFIPIPFFFDFGRFSFLYIKIDDYDYIADSPLIPMPIGAIAFFLSIIIGYISAIANPGLFRSVFPPAKLLIFYSLVVLPLSLYAVFVSNLSLPRLVQLILPMTFISLLSFPVLMKDRLGVLKNTFLSAFLFFNIHFISVISTSLDFLNMDPNLEYSNIFGILIYQSLITYPAVMSLYLFLTLAMIYVARKDILPLLRKYKYFYYYFLFILLYLLAVSGRRAFLVEFISAFIVIITFSIIYGISRRYVAKKTLWYFLLFVSLFVSFFIFYINTPVSQRVLESIQENTFDSGRVDILGSAFEFFTNNLLVLFFGGGERDIPGFHNFILDQIYRIGLIGFLSVYVTMGMLIRRFVKTNDLGTVYRYQRSMFMFILLSSLFLQSMINASVSQPYYFVNFLVVSILVYFVLFTQNKVKNKSLL